MGQTRFAFRTVVILTFWTALGSSSTTYGNGSYSISSAFASTRTSNVSSIRSTLSSSTLSFSTLSSSTLSSSSISLGTEVPLNSSSTSSSQIDTSDAGTTGSNDAETSVSSNAAGGIGSYIAQGLGDSGVTASTSRNGTSTATSSQFTDDSTAIDTLSYVPGTQANFSNASNSSSPLQTYSSSNGSSILADQNTTTTGTGSKTTTIYGVLGTGANTATITQAPTWNNASISGPSTNYATYGNHTFLTICPDNSTSCMSQCVSMVNLCGDEYDTWSSSNSIYQKSIIGNGTTPSSAYSTTTYTESDWTLHSFERSWSTYYDYYTAGPAVVTRTSCDISACALSTLTYTSSYTITSTHYAVYAVGGTGVPTETVTIHPAPISVFSEQSNYPWSVPIPTCSPSYWLSACSYSGQGDRCTITGGSVQLLYWPAKATATANGTFANSTASPTITGMVTATARGITMVSPSVYISFETVYAVNNLGETIGKPRTADIMAFNPEEISSVQGGDRRSATDQYGSEYLSYWGDSPFNYADITWPVPATAYLQQPRCFQVSQDGSDTGGCPIILDDYNPVLVVPGAVRGLDPAWASCALDWQGLYDPPSALQPASSADGPSVPVPTIQSTTSTSDPKPTSEPAEPGSSTTIRGPSQTPGVSSITPVPTPVDPSTIDGPAPTSLPTDPSPSQPADDPSTTPQQQPSGQPISDLPSDDPTPTTPSPGQPADNPSSEPQQESTGQPISDPQPGDSTSKAASPSQPADDPSSNTEQQPTGQPIANPPSGDPTSTPSQPDDDPSSETQQPSSGSNDPVPAAADPASTKPIISADPSPGSGAGGLPSAGPTSNAGGDNPGSTPSDHTTTLPSPVTVGSGSNALTIAPASSSNVIIVGGNGQDSITLQPGASTEINSTPLSVDGSGNVIVGSTPGSSPTPVAVIGTDTIQPNPSGSGVAVGNGIISPGQATTIQGSDGPATVSVNDQGAVIVASAGTTKSLALNNDPQGVPQVTTVSFGSGAAATLNQPANAAASTIAIAPDGGFVNTGAANSDSSAAPVDALQVLSAAQAADTSSVVLTGSAGQAFTALASGGNIVIGTATIADGQATSIAGLGVVSLGPFGLVVPGGAQATGLVPTAAAVLTNSAGQTLTAAVLGGSVAIGSVTLTDGQTTSIAGLGTVVANSNGLVLNGQTVPFTAVATLGPQLNEAGAAITEATFAVDGRTYTAYESMNGGSVVLDGTTLSQGQVVTIGSQTIKVESNGLAIVSAGRTTTAPFMTTRLPSVTEATFVVDGRTYTAYEDLSGDGVVLDGTTLSEGQVITIGSQVVSVGSEGLAIVDAGRTTTASFMTTQLPSSGIVEVEALITAGATILTAFQIAGHSGSVVVDGKTLSIGGPEITVSGEVISLASNGLVVHGVGETGSETLAFSTVTVTDPESELGLMASGLGPWSSGTLEVSTTSDGATQGTSPTGLSSPTSTSAGLASVEQHGVLFTVTFATFWAIAFCLPFAM
ncbi:hypothetical protein LTR10_008005 [Elasticomyces elasticus]|nr:hypothetical protein LTR10_008005 [Elasticomyces elasticus]KAK4971002.1 hypothetical protein LTR42_007981 [Elasticomyces elasticus]